MKDTSIKRSGQRYRGSRFRDGPLLIRLGYLAYYYDTKAVFIPNNEAMGEVCEDDG